LKHRASIKIRKVDIMVKIESKSFRVYAVVSKIGVDGEIKCESVTFDAPVRDSRAAQKAIATSYKVKAKDVNVLKIETVKHVYKFDADGIAILDALQSAGFEPVDED
jgi:hypothetical protein